MRVHVDRLDLQKTRETWPADEVFAPALVRPKKGDPTRFLVLDSPLSETSGPLWADNARDNYLRIPLFCHSLPGEVDLAFAHLFQLALRGTNSLAYPVSYLHIVTGFPVDLVSLSDKNTSVCLQYWFGFAVALDI
jgi:hypothetical protein